jgi:hypothetical protein
MIVKSIRQGAVGVGGIKGKEAYTVKTVNIILLLFSLLSQVIFLAHAYVT